MVEFERTGGHQMLFTLVVLLRQSIKGFGPWAFALWMVSVW